MICRLKLIICLILFVNCQFLLAINVSVHVFGKISCNQKGVANVLISDGIDIVKTDKNGKYKLPSSGSKFVYIINPSGYILKSNKQQSVFYNKIVADRSGKMKVDFELEKSSNDSKHMTIICTDPQVGFEEDMSTLQSLIDDMKSLRAGNQKEEFIGLMCGDLIENIKDSTTFIPRIKNMFSSLEIPFYYLAGNHDMNLDVRSNYNSKKTFESYFGPRYYSFNKGKVHYVVLDNVFSTGRGYGYIGYIDEDQLAWLEKDLSYVEKGSTVLVSMHIPTYSAEARRGEYNKEAIHKTTQNRQALYDLLKDYKVHIISGHEHYAEHYNPRPNILEHVCPALCGIFWQSPYNFDGTPLGYLVFDIDGTNIQWKYKSLYQDINTQFDAYITADDKSESPTIIANVWNYDSLWKVYWYENDILKGEMSAFKGSDPAMVRYVKQHQQSFRYKYIGAGTTEHLFRANGTSAASKYRIEVVDRFGNKYTKEPRLID